MTPEAATKLDRAVANVLVWILIVVVLVCLLAVPVLLVLWLAMLVDSNLPSFGTLVNAAVFFCLAVFGVTLAFYCGARVAIRHCVEQQLNSKE